MRKSEPTMALFTRQPAELVELARGVAARRGVSLTRLVRECLAREVGWDDE